MLGIPILVHVSKIKINAVCVPTSHNSACLFCEYIPFIRLIAQCFRKDKICKANSINALFVVYCQ